MARKYYWLLWLASLCSTGCNTHKQTKFTIVATTSFIADALKNIVQDHVNVITLMGPGIDPHTYHATQQDIQHLLNANMVFYNGLHLEGKMIDILQKLGREKPVYAVGDAIKATERLTDPNFSVGIDPHIWFDVKLWQQVVQYMSDYLQKATPDKAHYYQENTQRYLQQLDQLHQDTLQAIQQVPEAQRVLITAHDAFGYFGRAYAMEVRGLQGISTVSECGLKDVINLVNFIIKRNIKAIFLETSVPEKPLQAVVEGCRARGHQVVIGGYLYSDALGQQGISADNYCGMFEANVKTIVEALK